MELETIVDKDEIDLNRIQLKVTTYITRVGNVKGKTAKLEILNLLFMYLAGPGAPLLLADSRFNRAVKEKLYNFYFNDCLEECISWWKMIYHEDIHIHRVSPMPRMPR